MSESDELGSVISAASLKELADSLQLAMAAGKKVLVEKSGRTVLGLRRIDGHSVGAADDRRDDQRAAPRLVPEGDPGRIDVRCC